VLWGVHNFLWASGANASTVTTVMTRLNTKVDNDLVNPAELRAMRFGDTQSMPMLIGQATTPRVWFGVIGYLANRDRGNTAKATSYLNAVSTTADYFLGGNPLNMCWVSGVGERSPLGVFHLDWFASDNLYVNGPGGNRKDIRAKRGFVPYGIWRSDRSDWGWWSPVFGHKTAYPAIPTNGVNTGTACTWPGHEMYFDDRNAPLPAENTIHQTQGPSALIYGFLYAVASGGTTPPPPPPAGLINGGIYEIAPTHALGMRLDVNAASNANGANVHIWTANGTSAQRWKLFDVGSGVYELEPQCAIGKRLDVVGWGTADGTNVDIWQDVDQANERWKLIDVGGGNYELEPQNAIGKRLDVNNWGTTDGSNVQIWQGAGQANQRWRFTLVSSARMAASLEDKAPGQLLVYPNPSQGGAFQVSLPKSQKPLFLLTNSLGQTIPVASQQLGDGHYQLTPRTNLASGLYFIRVKTTDGEQVSKMVVH
nr:RICIN domain-containing protein [Cytophagales bacterium]